MERYQKVIADIILPMSMLAYTYISPGKFKKSYERLLLPTTNAFLVESTILFAILLQLVALHCTSLHTIANLARYFC